MYTPAQKAAATKDIKSQAEYLADLESAYKKQGYPLRFWYLGDQYSPRDITEEKRILKGLQKKREIMNNK